MNVPRSHPERSEGPLIGRLITQCTQGIQGFDCKVPRSTRDDDAVEALKNVRNILRELLRPLLHPVPRKLCAGRS
jgi:hypothetical protein